MQATTQAIEVRKLLPALGAEILGVDLQQPLSDETFQQILNAWHENLVILLRNQSLTEEQQWQFGTRFGPLSGGYIRELETPDHEGVLYVTNVREKDGKPLVGILPDGEMHFHSDQSYTEKPSQGTMLYAIKVPREGGNTLFANCYAAYETLREDVKQRISKLRALHVYDYNANPTHRPREIPANAPRWSHPIVRVHPVTGRKALYVNRLMTACIEGIPAKESEELLNMLFGHMEQKRFIYEHRWQPGDVLMWDNRCALHARTTFDPCEERMLRRVTLKGEPVKGIVE